MRLSTSAAASIWRDRHSGQSKEDRKERVGEAFVRADRRGRQLVEKRLLPQDVGVEAQEITRLTAHEHRGEQDNRHECNSPEYSTTNAEAKDLR